MSAFASASTGVRKQQHMGLQNKLYRIDVKSYCEKYKAAWLDSVPSGDDLTSSFSTLARDALKALKRDAGTECSDDGTEINGECYEHPKHLDHDSEARELWMRLFRSYG